MSLVIKPDLVARLAVLTALLFSSVGLRGESAQRPPPEFRFIPASAAIVEASAAAGMGLNGLAAPAQRNAAQPGDRVTALLTLTKGRDLQQWVVSLKTVAPNEADLKRPRREARFYSSMGDEFVFGSLVAALEITLVGPLREKDAGKKEALAPAIIQRRILAGADYLALGLDRVPALTLRMRERRKTVKAEGKLGVSTSPFPAEQNAESKRTAELLGFSTADARAIAGSVQGLLQFFEIANSTPGLQDVLKTVVDVPWWSILRGGGKINVGFDTLPFQRELDPAPWKLPYEAKVYAYPVQLTINGKPALLLQLAVVSPRPPLQTSAGVIGLAAGRPDGKGPVLTFQVIASQAAEATSMAVPDTR